MTKITIFEKNHGLTPLENTTFSTFCNRCFYRPKSLFLYVERDQTLFFGIFSLNRKGEKNYSFLRKLWTTPLKKMQILRLFQVDVFFSIKRLFIYLERHKTLLFGIFSLKRKNEKT